MLLYKYKECKSKISNTTFYIYLLVIPHLSPSIPNKYNLITQYINTQPAGIQ